MYFYEYGATCPSYAKNCKARMICTAADYDQIPSGGFNLLLKAI